MAPAAEIAAAEMPKMTSATAKGEGRNMPATRLTRKTKSGELLDLLSQFDEITIVMHDNPDPDAIAAGWGIQTLVEERLTQPVALVGGGAIVRAENRHMVDLLSPPIELVDHLAVHERAAVVLVDCGLGTTNHLVTRLGISPVAVIDHHLRSKVAAGVPFLDSRPDVAASASIAASYLREQGIEPGEKLATAMLYALRAETRAFETHHSDLDRSVLRWLTERADPSMLAEIESAPLSREYFGELALALQSTTVFGDTAFCLLPRAEGAEIVGELADLLVRCRSIRRVLSGAVVEGDLVVSVRTERSRDSASRLVQTLLKGLGSGGGHAHRAGGKIAGLNGVPIRGTLKDELRQRWLEACGIAEASGTPLVSRTEILENLG
jgi:nanoRNase/pAp phosphatase (c-di-AMP/oligoRNAs hydrolase)